MEKWILYKVLHKVYNKNKYAKKRKQKFLEKFE